MTNAIIFAGAAVLALLGWFAAVAFALAWWREHDAHESARCTLDALEHRK